MECQLEPSSCYRGMDGMMNWAEKLYNKLYFSLTSSRPHKGKIGKYIYEIFFKLDNNFFFLPDCSTWAHSVPLLLCHDPEVNKRGHSGKWSVIKRLNLLAHFSIVLSLLPFFLHTLLTFTFSFFTQSHHSSTRCYAPFVLTITHRPNAT